MKVAILILALVGTAVAGRHNAFPPRFAPMDSAKAEAGFDSAMSEFGTDWRTEKAGCAGKRSMYVGWLRDGEELPTKRTISGWVDAEFEGDPSTFCFTYNKDEER